MGGKDNATETDNWHVVGEVAVNDRSGAEAQGMVQYTQDNKATTGVMTLKFDYDFGAASGDYDLYLYVFGWNSGDAAPGMDFENGDAETGDSFSPTAPPA